ncbi:hypothetical protein [Bradyrhizobium sp. ARR65]|uniref:hypothetical protein n=1 Tax=Bradyrhizobium sp. ARR65 TaxID=1040989 RepID=UPI000467788B|nr:hypothetical protein [Bradyrhizobium sp. ARR65]
MDRLAYLQDQALRAERLAKSITDTLTIERLQSFAAECRRQIKLISGSPDHILRAAKLHQAQQATLAQPPFG